MARITINGISTDPLYPQAAIDASNFHAPDAADSDYILIQTRQPLDKGQKGILAAAGIKILEYIPGDTYLASYTGTDLGPVRALPFVAWVNIYMKDFKIATSLLKAGRGEERGINTLEEAMIHPLSAFANPSSTVDVVFQKDVDPETIRKELADAAHLDAATLQIGRRKARISVESRYLPALAAIDKVRHIEEVVPNRLLNDVARQIIWAGAGNPASALRGNGQIVAVADTGFDKGSVTDVHPAFNGRVKKIYPLGRTGQGNDSNGHGTHVAGSVLGDYDSAVLGRRISGMAPEAMLVFQSLLTSNGGLQLPDDLHDLFAPPYDNENVRIHTNSWGGTIGDSRYDSNAAEVDDFVWGHRDMVICFAAGNEGRDDGQVGRISPGSITSPGTAKNCITAGASENNRPEFSTTYGNGWPVFRVDPIADDLVADNPEGMAAFSSRGPTQDHRIKPDLVAPGTYILSALSRDVSPQNPPGWHSSDDPLLFFDGGTSMSTPLIAGSVAVVREYLVTERQMTDPSAALVKALLINGAKAMAGQYTPSETGPVPNGSDGFGRVDLEFISGAIAPSVLILKDEATLLDTSEQEQTMVNIPAGVSLLKATLVWTDPAGEKLQNDLDLIVQHANGQERHGNMPADAAGFDRDNNVEQVIWENIPEGTVTVTIRAFRIAQFQQPYALVIRMG